MNYGGYGYNSGYGMYGSHGGFFGGTSFLTGLFGFAIQLLFFLLIISIIAAAIVFLKRTLVDNTGVFASPGRYTVSPSIQARQCPHCQTSVKQSYSFCPVCGTSLTATTVQPVETKTTPEPTLCDNESPLG